MKFEDFKKTGQIFYQGSESDHEGRWYAIVDWCPIAPGHVHVRHDDEVGGFSIPPGFSKVLAKVAEALRDVFKENWRVQLPKLSKKFPRATGEPEQCIWYRLGGSDPSFHVHVVPWFEGHTEAATKLLHGRFLPMQEKERPGGMLFWLGLQENEKDGRLAEGKISETVEKDERYNLKRLVELLEESIKSLPDHSP